MPRVSQAKGKRAPQAGPQVAKKSTSRAAADRLLRATTSRTVLQPQRVVKRETTSESEASESEASTVPQRSSQRTATQPSASVMAKTGRFKTSASSPRRRSQRGQEYHIRIRPMAEIQEPIPPVRRRQRSGSAAGARHQRRTRYR